MARHSDYIDQYYKSSDLSLLNKLTLVIPTYNRNFYLSRCLWYHAHFPFARIIVADSSPKEKKIVNRATVDYILKKFSVDILYLEYQPETDIYGEDIYQKWADASFHVNSEYIKINTDKEFTVPETACACIKFLENNSDYFIADGVSIEAYYNENKKLSWNLWCALDKSYSADTPHKRIADAFSHRKKYRYLGTMIADWNFLTAIRRTEFHQYLYHKLLEYHLNDLRFGDYGQQLFSLLSSKRKHINKILLIRDNSYLRLTNNIMESSSSRYPKVSDFKPGCLNEKIESLLSFAREIAHDFNDTKLMMMIESGYFLDECRILFEMYPSEEDISQKYKFGTINILTNKLVELIPIQFQKKVRDSIMRRIIYKLSHHVHINNSYVTDFEIITKCILETMNLHETDAPII